MVPKHFEVFKKTLSSQGRSSSGCGVVIKTTVYCRSPRVFTLYPSGDGPDLKSPRTQRCVFNESVLGGDRRSTGRSVYTKEGELAVVI